MERNYDEVIAEMLIELYELQEQSRKFNRRLDLTITRMVKAENRLEAQEKRMEAHDTRMQVFDRKLDQSIKDQKEFSIAQSQINKYFLDIIKKNGDKQG